MIIYKCLLTGDEMFSDIYKIITTKEGLFEVEGKLVSRNVGDIDESLIGGNASAEEVGEGTDAATESGVDIILNHNLMSTTAFDKKGFVAYLKTYMKALKTKIVESTPDKVEEFQAEAQLAGKKLVELVSKNKDLEFFTGSSMNPDGMVALLDYRDDGTTPYMIFMKCGLEIEKC